MRSIVEAIEARVKSTGLPVYLTDVPEGVSPTFPYVIVWFGTGKIVPDDLGDTDLLADRIGVTNVGVTPESVLSITARTRAVLRGWAPAPSAWHVQPLRIFDGQDVQPDRDVTLPDSNRHPYFGVDLYRLVAEPKPPSSSSSSS